MERTEIALVAVSPEDGKKVVLSEHNIEASTADVETKYPTRFHLASIVLALSLCVFLVGLDGTIIATASPSITDEFKSTAQLGWYAAAYRIASCAAQLSQGQLYTLFPLKLVFIVNLVLFEVGALVSGTAQSSTVLIIGRAISGLGFSGVSQGCMVIIAFSSPLDRRATFLGLISASEFFAIAVAPLIGGALTSDLSWRWCFYLNVIVAVVPAAAILLLIKTPPREKTEASISTILRKIDFLGIVLFAPAIVCLLLALQWAGSVYPWSDGRIIALFVVAGALFVAFGLVQMKKQETAMLPPRILRQRSMVFGSVYACGLASVLAITQYYSAVWFQAVAGDSADESGIRTLPLVIGLLVASVLTGFLITKLGRYKAIQCFAAVLVVTGAAVQCTVHVDSGSELWIPALVLIGVGAGAGVACPFLAAQAALTDDDVPIGMALLTFSQDFGEALSVGIAQALFLNGLMGELESRLPQLNTQEIVNLGVTAYRMVIDAADLGAVEASYSDAVRGALYLAVAFAACTVAAGACTRSYRLKD